MGSSSVSPLPGQPAGSSRVNWPRHLVWIIATFAVLEGFQQQHGDWFRWRTTVRYNPQFQEAWAWWHGRLDLRYLLWDTAHLPDQGTVYNVYPPLQSIIAFLLEAPYAGQDAMPEFRLAPFLLFALPLPVLGYRVFFRRTRSPAWAAALTLGWIGGTALMPCIDLARQDDFHHVNHLLSQVGLLLLVDEVLGRRRMGIMLSALLVAAWSRQLTGLFGIAVAYAAVRPPSEATLRNASTLRRRTLAFAAGLSIIISIPMTLNWMKFGDPFDSGYEHIYYGRETQAAENVRTHGIFSPRFVPKNAFYMNIASPIARDGDGRFIWKPSPDGASLWLSTPLAFLAWIGIRSWWRNHAARALMLCSIPIVCGHLLYHNTGFVQHGYYRFALDYLPVWLVVATPWLTTGWRRWATLACIGWSLSYFALLRHWSGPAAI